jgi:hypothetical protein
MIAAPLVAPVSVSSAPITAAAPISPAGSVIDVHEIIAATDDRIPTANNIVVIPATNDRTITISRPISAAYNRSITRPHVTGQCCGTISNSRPLAAAGAHIAG